MKTRQSIPARRRLAGPDRSGHRCGLVVLVPVLLLTACESGESTEASWSSRGRTAEDASGWPTTTASLGARPDAPASDDHAMADTGVASLESLHMRALDELLAAADANNPLLLANAIEAMQPYPQGIVPVVRRGLMHENRGVRFTAAMVAGRLELRDVSDLLQPLLHDEHDSVRAAALYAKHRLGGTVDLTPLAAMLRSNSAEVKANAAYVLGELGESSAAPMLNQSLGRGLSRESAIRARIVDLQIAEAMIKLGDEEHLPGVRAALFAPVEQAELIAFACQICGNVRDRVVLPDLHNLALRTGERQMPPEVRMSAAMALAKMDALSREPWTVPQAYCDDDRATLRAQAAITLGEMGRYASLPLLAALLEDEDPLVRVAAAGGILRIR